MKLDTQGYELEVLKGASHLIQGLDALLLEVSLLPINVGCPLFAEVLAFLTDKGFTLFDFCSQIRRRDGVLWQTDLFFVRRQGPIRISPTLTPETWHTPARMLPSPS